MSAPHSLKILSLQLQSCYHLLTLEHISRRTLPHLETWSRSVKSPERKQSGWVWMNHLRKLCHTVITSDSLNLSSSGSVISSGHSASPVTWLSEIVTPFLPHWPSSYSLLIPLKRFHILLFLRQHIYFFFLISCVIKTTIMLCLYPFNLEAYSLVNDSSHKGTSLL